MLSEWDKYTRWLIDNLYWYSTPWNYMMLIDLNNVPYRWNNEEFPMDENRAFDGISLRKEYPNYKEIQDIPCSILEMLMALAIRIDREYIGDPHNPRPDLFFDEMMDNMNFDFIIIDERAKNHIIDAFCKWTLKKSGPNGYNTPFPIKNPVVPQNELQIWDQAQAYIYKEMNKK